MTAIAWLGACSSQKPTPELSLSTAGLPDSLMIQKHRTDILRDYMELDSNVARTSQELDSLWDAQFSNMYLNDGQIFYAPDSSFSIFLYEGEDCGAYCNPFWESYIHYLKNGYEIIEKSDFKAITAIHKLPDGKYLILESSYGRPASVLTVECRKAHLLSFSKEGLRWHPIRHRSGDTFEFCQENEVDMETTPYLNFDTNSLALSYFYGNNYLYSHGLDLDTLRKGELNYLDGRFVVNKKFVRVRDSRNQVDE